MSPQNLTQRFRTVCLQRLELPELCHRRNERPSPGFAKGDHHQCLPRHRLLCSGKHRILHNAQCVRSPGLRGSRSGESISPIHYLSFLLDFCWPAVWAFCISDTCRCGSLHFRRSERDSTRLIKVHTNYQESDIQRKLISRLIYYPLLHLKPYNLNNILFIIFSKYIYEYFHISVEKFKVNKNCCSAITP